MEDTFKGRIVLYHLFKGRIVLLKRGCVSTLHEVPIFCSKDSPVDGRDVFTFDTRQILSVSAFQCDMFDTILN